MLKKLELKVLRITIRRLWPLAVRRTPGSYLLLEKLIRRQVWVATGKASTIRIVTPRKED